mmetsp:Transcript_35361/g.56708  ORF Transcript_35361/g.56708 Transcript_35361/m.56708 type:complete len:432 (+) Transcript_35361:33-1328(+)
MAAILCRYCFVEPCKALGKCCEGCCKCMGSCCDCFSKCLTSCCDGFAQCCDRLGSLCDKPFSGCLITSVLINLAALIFGVVGVVSGGSQCNKPLIVLGILLLVCTIINSAFSYYVYRTINHDENNPLFSDQAATTASSKLYAFVKYDKWMAVYILFVLLLIALLCTSIVMAGSCDSDIGNGVFWVSIIIFIYIGVASLIVLSYVAFDAFREWSKTCWCWAIPVCWPCLCIGCCLNCAEDYDTKNNRYYQAPQSQGTVNDVSQTQPQYRATSTQQQPVQVVVQQPVQIQPAPQMVTYAQPQPQQTTTYAQPTPQYQQQPMYNPQGAAPIQPGVVYMHQQPAATNTYQTQPPPQEMNNENANEEQDGIDYDEIKEKGKKAAKAAGKQAKKAGVAAMGWMAKKVNELNEKVQDDKTAAANPDGQEGNNANQQTY